ncbi:MAG: AAA family ATPase [Methanobrevibacter sp.]|nr:AAA family ATPase [Methanobrevibacter sp.]
MDKERITDYIYEKLAEAPILLEDYLITDDVELEHREIYFKIKKHVDDFLEGYIENRFITLAGLRGIGKTTVLFQIYSYLKNEKNIAEDRILYISADELTDFLGANLYESINDFIEEIHDTRAVSLKKELFILIDEAQYDKNWSKAGKILYDKTKKIFFIFTGSSAINFEMNVDAVRRIKKEPTFPLNFHEYILLKDKISLPKGYDDALINLMLNGDKLDDIHGDKLDDINRYELEDINVEKFENMRNKEKEMRKKLLKLNNTIKKEHEKFLLYGNFPFGLNMDKEEIYRRIFHMVDRVIEKDIFLLKTFSTNTKSTISQIITYLALQDPGGTSDKKLATMLSKPQKQIREILNTLEKTHLIFPVKPYGSVGKQVRKPWKYYFLAPSINAAIRYKLGKFRRNDRKFIGLLAENHVASYFFKIKETKNQYLNIYYDPSDYGVDFLLETGENIIPVEVSIGKKDKKQIIKAINKYKSKYGIIISNTTEKIEKRANIIYIPLTTIP